MAKLRESGQRGGKRFLISFDLAAYQSWNENPESNFKSGKDL
jgi:hypothetical protein